MKKFIKQINIKLKKVILPLLVVSFFACQDASKPADNNAITKADTLVSPALNRSLAQPISLDSLVIVADAKGNITVGNQAVDFEKLESNLVDTLQFIEKNVHCQCLIPFFITAQGEV